MSDKKEIIKAESGATTESKEKSEVVMAEYLFREAVLPEPTERISKGRVEYGAKNLYPQYLYGLFYGSPIHGGIINQKVTFISGNGLEGTGIFEGKLDEINKNSTSDLTLDELSEGYILDLEVLEYFYILYKKDITTGIWYANELSGELMRPREDLKSFEYSEDWSKTSQTPEKTGWKVYKSIFEVVLEDDLEKGLVADTECVMYVKTPSKQILLENGKLTSSIFPIPAYSGAITSIMADIEMNWFHYAEVVNNWSSNTILNLNDGIPENEEQKKKILKEIKEQSTDKKKKGGMTVFFNDGKERAASLEVVGGNGNDVRYIMTQEHLVTSIMIGESVQNPALFGLQIAGKLGGSSDNDLHGSFARFNETYASKRRKRVVEPLTFGLKHLNGLEEQEGEIVFKQYIPSFQQATDEDDEILGILSRVSPLLANAMLGSMTDNEKRGKLLGLPPVVGGDTIKAVDFSAEGTEGWILAEFMKAGKPSSEVSIVSSDAFDYKKPDSDFVNEYLIETFALDLTEDHKKILQMVKGGESFGAVNTAIGKGAVYLAKNILTLKSNGFIKALSWEITDQGEQSIATVEQLSVVYTYELRPDAPALVAGGTSRDFCKTLIQLNRVYTREEVNSISAAVSRDVWLYRGGWYHDPESDKNQPSCRHFWKQNIISG